MGAIHDLFLHLSRSFQEEYDAAVEAAYWLAETETNGVLVSREGQRRGKRGYDLFRGSEATALRWASEELLDHWTRHPRPHRAHMEEQWLLGRMPYT